MYNYQGPPGQYGAPPGYGGFPGQAPPGMGLPPGMGPPGMPPPGVGLPPGMQQAHAPQQGGFPPNFQPSASMPNIDFTAPVIRMGTTGPGKPDTTQGTERRRDGGHDGGNRRGAGLGFDARGGDRDRPRENVNLAPPTREEIARTIFVGNITDGCKGDDGMQQILATAGGLRRWTRAIDAENKPCTFGFAEFEDAESLGTAVELFKDVEVPVQTPRQKGEGDDDSVEKSTLLVVVDENSLKYIEEWRDRGAMKDPAAAQFRLDSAREDLQQVLAGLFRPMVSGEADGNVNGAGDTNMLDADAKNEKLGEIITIPLSAEDELADIPAEMRETVAREIQAFRDRSNRRDMERLKREEEMENAARRPTGRPGRAVSPTPSTQANVPAGPRDRGVQGAPSGPKGYSGAQLPRDYQAGVAFVNGSGANGAGINEEDDDTDASDEELERRRQEKKAEGLEKLFMDQERRWLNRERSKTAAVEREKQRDQDEAANRDKAKAAVAKRYKEWNDDTEASRRVEEYYHDRSVWLRHRAAVRAREAEADHADRAAEAREQARDRDRRNRELGLADDFLAAQAAELEVQQPPQAQHARAQPFKMSLGAAAQRAQAATAPRHRRTIAEVEGLLEDEEDAESTTQRRTLIPIEQDARAAGAGGPGAALSDAERAQAARQLASDIPTDREGLWAWPVKWEHVDDAVVTEQLRPFVEKKIVEYLGVQEQMLVDVMEQCVRKRGSPQELVGELEGALDEEAEVLVKKLWRMLIFFSESELRGLAG